MDLARAFSPTEDVRVLVEELESELMAEYPPEQRHGLKVEAIFQPHIQFYVATVDGEPAGCGGVALFEDFAELKRMYVRPSFRGRGIADSILARLIAEAERAGLTLVRLETGTNQLAAIRFYRRCGFEECEAFEPYASMEPHRISTSYFMEMRLGP